LITQNVNFYPHGGDHIMRNTEPNFDAFGKIFVKEVVYIGACSLIVSNVTDRLSRLAVLIVTRSVSPGS
jgi:hypothetical protein